MDAKHILEAALICAQAPLTMTDMQALYDGALDGAAVRQLLTDLDADWHERGLELVQVATGWRFQSRPRMQIYLDRVQPEQAPRYSRAVMETLAIIAYRQPVTRGDMEQIRGVTIHSNLLRQLEDRGWIEIIGRRDTVGRPALYATTPRFLDDLALQSLQDLPPLPDLAHDAAGVLPLPSVAANATSQTIQAPGASEEGAAGTLLPGREESQSAEVVDCEG